jgi:molybdopterin molybdotransferase
MISLEQAQAQLFALAKPVNEEDVKLDKAAGRVLSADLIAKRTQPARDLSAMDGFAVRYDAGEGPWTIMGESAAGKALNTRLLPGQTARIFTGAVMPPGADTVIIQEDCTFNDQMMTLIQGTRIEKHQHVRKKGGDFNVGACLIKSGTRLKPAHIGLAAMGGYGAVTVRRKVRIALISTGDELVPPGEETQDDQIPSSNAVMLSALMNSRDVEVKDCGIIKDNINDLKRIIQYLNEYDIIVTIGGASVGDHDLVRPALIELGAEIDFWKIAMRPGKPVMAGRLGRNILLGLPGNPVSAYVTALRLLVPLVDVMTVCADAKEPFSKVKSAVALPQNGQRLDHIRAVISGDSVRPIGINDSAQLAALAQSNALIVRQPHAQAVEIGAFVECIMLP